MAPRIEKTQERAEVTRTYDVDGAEPITNYSGREFVPSAAVVRFVDGEWREMTISGGRLRKDGSAGTAPANALFYPGEYGNSERLPEWAKPLTRYEEGGQ